MKDKVNHDSARGGRWTRSIRGSLDVRGRALRYAQRYVDMPDKHGHILKSKAAFPFEPTYAASIESAS